jgi:hypothetical protein
LPALNISDPQVRNLNIFRVTLLLTVFRNPADYVCDLPKTPPPPSCWEIRKRSVIDICGFDQGREPTSSVKPTARAAPRNLVFQDFGAG